MHRWIARLALSGALFLGGCCIPSPGAESSEGSETPPAQPASPSAAPTYLTVGAFCAGWCGDLCGRCGDAACETTCPLRCHFGRDPSTVMDGTNPSIALAKTQPDLDQCLADARAVECPMLMSGQVIPQSCRTIQR
jgi:hypothetical protein